MKYKVGDKVKVKSLDWYNENKDKDGEVPNLDGWCFTPDMSIHCGQVFGIVRVTNGIYRFNGLTYGWTDEMIECKVEDKIDLVEILKDCPKGTKLYSTLFGEVYFSHIEEGSEYSICVEKNGESEFFTREGLYHGKYPDAECTLFPSKENRDWSTFKAPRWRAEVNETYYVSGVLDVSEKMDSYSILDDKFYNMGNYFRTEEEAREKLKEIKQLFLKK